MDANAGGIVRGSDEFDAGGFKCAFDSFQVCTRYIRESCSHLCAPHRTQADTTRCGKISKRPRKCASRSSYLCSSKH